MNRRLGCPRGYKKASGAVAHVILRAAYQILARHCTYQDLGADYFDQRHRERVTRRAVQLLERLGYQVTLEQAA